MGGGSEPKKQLGKILLQQKLVSADALQEMLEDQKREPGARLASTGARTGRFSMTDALHALSEQHGLPSIDLTEQVVPLGTLRLIPIEIARERSVFAFGLEGEQLLLALSSPDERELIEELEFVTGKKIQPFVGLDEVIRRVIDYAYGALDRGEEYYVGAHVTELQLATLGLPDLPRAPVPLSAFPPAVAIPDASPPQPPPEPEALAASPVRTEQPALGGALDIAFAQRLPPSHPPQMRAPDRSARVLLAAQDPGQRGVLAHALHEAGLGVMETDDGGTLLEWVRTEQPRLLVLGSKLRGVQGIEIVRKLRASPRHAELPIVVLCDAFGGWRMAQDLNECFGIKHCFDAPLDVGKLTRVVRLLLEGQVVPEEPPALSPEAEAKWNGGMAAFERGDLEAAIVQLEAGAAIDPQAFELQYHLGLLYGRRDDLFAAIGALEVAVNLQPRHFSAIKNLAVVYQRIGFRHKALDAWERATTAAPDDETRTNIKQHMVSLL